MMCIMDAAPRAPKIGKTIRRARERKRISQQEAAERLGVSRSALNAWENDRAYPRNSVGALEELYGISIDDEPEPDPIPPDMMDSIRRNYRPEDQKRIIDMLRREASPPTEPGEEGESGAQPGAGLAARWYAASATRCACKSRTGAAS